jgi:pimeloyl-ACP methyl ester carboxylesterase
VLAPDLSGCGESSWATAYSYAQWLEELAALVGALVSPPFALTGVSQGGQLAYLYAARHSEQVERLVIVDIAPEYPPAGVEMLLRNMPQADVFDAPEAAMWARELFPFAPEAELRRLTLGDLKRREDGRWTYRADPALMKSGPLRIGAADQWAALASLACPTLLVRGAHSYLLARETAERVAATVPNCRLVEVPDAAHGVPHDNPAGFLEALRRSCRRRRRA